MTEPSNLRDAAEVYEEFAPIVEDSIYLAEHEAVMASIKIGGWLSAALDDPAVCDAMKADIERWFSAGFLYLDEVRKLMQTEREALEAENERLRSTNLTDVELEAACHAVGIFLYGPDAERFEKMFDAAMTARTALERIDRD